MATPEGEWRECMGIEPTEPLSRKDPTGFEDQAEHQLGFPVTREQIDELKQHRDTFDWERVAELREEVGEDATAQNAAVAMMPGAFSASTTLDLFTWVNEKRYEIKDGEDFQRYHARRIEERSNGGTD